MKIAFDWNGVLDNNDMGRRLFDVLYQISLDLPDIELCIVTSTDKAGIPEREDFANEKGIPLFNIIFPLHFKKGTARSEFSGAEKLKICKEQGVDFLVDDNPIVCAVVNKGGIKTLRLS